MYASTYVCMYKESHNHNLHVICVFMFLSIAHLQEDEPAHLQDAEAKCRYILCKYIMCNNFGNTCVCLYVHTYGYTIVLAVIQ